MTGEGAPGTDARLRALPSVDRLAAAIGDDTIAPGEAVAAARAVLAVRREELLAESGSDAAVTELAERGRAWLRPSMRRVLNGTGIVLHTNLGRAPLAAHAAAAVARAASGSSNLELDLTSGRRGSRHDHVRGLLCELTGAEDALAVNNGAGAALLALAAVCGSGCRVPSASAVAVSRGQLVEIGGGFRIPDVLAQAGARMVEVGSTNRTRLADYERALEPCEEGGDGADAILRVHPSNFRTVGFVEEVEIEPLCALGVPVIDDVGSGALASGLAALAGEPPVVRSVAAGAAIVCFSGDKLLGGPQAGLLVGRAAAIDACRDHPLARALRIGRLPLAALAATLELHRDPARARTEIPVLAMLDADVALLRTRAERLAHAAARVTTGNRVDVTLVETSGRVGGGALPLLELPTVALSIVGSRDAAAAIARGLRESDPPLLARIADGRVLIDVRTLADDELDDAASAIAHALDAPTQRSPTERQTR